jgi:putative transposase
MARPLRIEYPGAFYHVTSRGNERKDVFKSRKDREKFLFYLDTATERYGAVVHVWCQLSNHYHLLLETPAGNLSEIMHHLNGAYTTYFNVKRKRSGHLFQGRYKAILVDRDEYAKELSRYIHLNPVRAGIVDRPEDYEWCSYRSYIGHSAVPNWLKTDFIHRYFANGVEAAQRKYRAFTEEKLGQEYQCPLAAVVGSSILGNEDFVEIITATYLDIKKVRDRNVSGLRQLSAQPSLEKILFAVERVFVSSKKQTRQAGIYFCHRYSGAKLREIGSLFGVKEPAVAAASHRFGLLLDEDENLRDQDEQVRRLLKSKI